ncbi:hypothetical protein OO013_12705 [Mangrovivirga sp. M17]|uniref:Uncharacterized protein n=1 Tax=Mangrovivirga halotolerans TaxID=2993936 RepID=A0ABT3RSY5_9BACT|nr:hypothetical protein [Mangrovivirga halotolerans]MCX2744735.1 hypothetical protein [Mangrovivirga halotolerans]
MKTPYLILMAFILIITSCGEGKEKTSKENTNIDSAFYNPPAPGFNMAESDDKAISIADSVMVAMGGRKAYDNTRFIGFDFFGFRKVWWDKFADSAIIKLNKKDLKILVDLDTRNGTVWKDGELLKNPDSIKYYANYGYEAWVNDTYWLLMPYKLKDSGVTLKYLREDTIKEGPAHVLQLTFNSVGVTPENKYEVFVDQSDNLIKKWAYYSNATDTIPGMATPWRGYNNYNGLLLSSDRGSRKLTDIVVTDDLSETPFSEYYHNDSN